MKEIDPLSNDNETYIQRELKELKKDIPNRLPLRRIWIMPTLIIIRPYEVDQTSPIVREVINFSEYLAKINILNDLRNEEFFNSNKTEELL